MKKIRYIKLCFPILVVLFSCKTNDSIELMILNEEINAYCLDSTCTKNSLYTNYEEYINKSKSIIKFKIKNNTKFTYLLNTYNLSNSNKDCFPKELRGISLENTIITENINSKKLEIYEAHSDKTFESLKLENIKDSITLYEYNKKGYIDKNFIFNNVDITNNIIEIPSGETRYFETYFNLPYNLDVNSGIQYVQLKKSKKYNLKLFFKSHPLEVKKQLTWSQIKNIEENNHKIFNGELISNSVPIIFKK